MILQILGISQELSDLLNTVAAVISIDSRLPNACFRFLKLICDCFDHLKMR